MRVVLARGRRGIPKMGDGSEPFCRGVKRAMDENPRLRPIDLDLDGMGATSPPTTRWPCAASASTASSRNSPTPTRDSAAT
jgi:hypothetical protein